MSLLCKHAVLCVCVLALTCLLAGVTETRRRIRGSGWIPSRVCYYVPLKHVNGSRTCENGPVCCLSARVAAISCAMPSNPRNGNVMISGGLGPGARISYSCQAGYEMMGSRQQQCQDNGQWSGSKPSCRMMQDEAEPTRETLRIGRFTFFAFDAETSVWVRDQVVACFIWEGK